jgi:hypothetical protein
MDEGVYFSEGIYMTVTEALIKFSFAFFLGIFVASAVFAIYLSSKNEEK